MQSVRKFVQKCTNTESLEFRISSHDSLTGRSRNVNKRGTILDYSRMIACHSSLVHGPACRWESRIVELSTLSIAPHKSVLRVAALITHLCVASAYVCVFVCVYMHVHMYTYFWKHLTLIYEVFQMIS